MYIYVHSLLGKCLHCQLEPDYTELHTVRLTEGDEYMAIKIRMAIFVNFYLFWVNLLDVMAAAEHVNCRFGQAPICIRYGFSLRLSYGYLSSNIGIFHE